MVPIIVTRKAAATAAVGPTRVSVRTPPMVVANAPGRPVRPLPTEGWITFRARSV
ncbi:hypothetical protein GCM10023175_06550 [Pseudonocardia xishanensis]|uniref:Uncharacterized protein n=1 Tax=Pseudonocardia xishanensis TaxID=630995 RepID=A0ABP8RFK5_9PSEU